MDCINFIYADDEKGTAPREDQIKEYMEAIERFNKIYEGKHQQSTLMIEPPEEPEK